MPRVLWGVASCRPCHFTRSAAQDERVVPHRDGGCGHERGCGAVPSAFVFDIFKLIFSPLAPSTKATSAQVYPFTRHLISFSARWVSGILGGY